MPVELAEQIFYVLNDTTLHHDDAELTSVFAAILCHLDRTLYDVYTLANDVCDSMKSACDFLDKTTHLKALTHASSRGGGRSTSDEAAWFNELITRAKHSLAYMEYHECKMLPARIVAFVAAICRHNANSSSLQNGDDAEDHAHINNTATSQLVLGKAYILYGIIFIFENALFYSSRGVSK